MNPTFNTETLQKLISKYKYDQERLEVIFEGLESFEAYHNAIFKMETTKNIFGGDLTDLDNARTNCHNLVISNVQMLNEWAEQAGFEPVYMGKIDKHRPFRTQLAHAVLAYVEGIIKNRAIGQ